MNPIYTFIFAVAFLATCCSIPVGNTAHASQCSGSLAAECSGAIRPTPVRKLGSALREAKPVRKTLSVLKRDCSGE